VEFARIFDDSLKATTERQEVETQQDRLLKAQRQWHEKIEGLQPRLQRLAQATQGNAKPYLALLDQVDRVCCTGSLEEFEHALKEEFERDKDKFSTAVEQVKALDELDRRYAQALLDARGYLGALEGVPEASSLTTDRDLLETRFVLDTFCQQPSQAGVVLEVFEQFKRSYSTHYQMYYREYRKQLVALDARLKKLGRRVDGLARMNQIEELGGGVAAELSIQYKDLLARCDAKALPEALPEVKDHPIFRGITLSTAAPEQDVTDFERRLEEALQGRLWQLADETIAAILKTRDSTPLQALLEAIQAADTLRLAEHFTDEVAELVRQVLRDARLVTVDVRLADYDGPAQLGDDPKEIDDVIAAFRSFLTRNIAAARQANPGKTVRLNLKAG